MSDDDDKTRILPPMAKTDVGTQLSGIYELDERIACGGMGEVYRGHNIQTGDHVAIKIVLPEFARDQTILSLFRKEASILNHLSHDAVVRYHVFTIDPGIGRPYLAMEFVDGESLFDMMRRGPMAPDEVRRLCHRVASGLSFVHKAGAVHRDLSPDNIILPGGSVERAKIIDFGIARSNNIGGETLIGGRFAGKYNYVSPEQLGLYGGEVSEKSDIYSLGLVLAAVLRGKPLDMNGSQFEIVEKRRSVPDLSGIDDEFLPLLDAMLQPDPQQRPTGAEIARTTRDETPADAEEVTAPRSLLRQRPGALPKAAQLDEPHPWTDSEGVSAASVPLSQDGRFVPHVPPPRLPPRSAKSTTGAKPIEPNKSRQIGLIAAVSAALVATVAGGAYFGGLLGSSPLPAGADTPELSEALSTSPPAMPTVAEVEIDRPQAQSAEATNGAADLPATNKAGGANSDTTPLDNLVPGKTIADLNNPPIAEKSPEGRPAAIADQNGGTAKPADRSDGSRPTAVAKVPATAEVEIDRPQEQSAGATNGASDLPATNKAGAANGDTAPLDNQVPGKTIADMDNPPVAKTSPEGRPVAIADQDGGAAKPADRPDGSRPTAVATTVPAATGSEQTSTAPPDRPTAPPAAPNQPPLQPSTDTQGETTVAMNLPKPQVPAEAVDQVATRVSWLREYSGGDCFYATATLATDKAMEIEGFGTAAEPFVQMMGAFQHKFGIEPDVSVRLIEPAQCEVTHFLNALGAAAPEKPDLTLDRTSVPDGSPISGTLQTLGGLRSSLLLVDHKGMVFNLDDKVVVQSGKATFSVPIGLGAADRARHKAVPQIIIAITGASDIDAAVLANPASASVVLPGILAEIQKKRRAFSATAKYFQLGG
ncbi:serine/threonine-protein kinase [Mesorhizobium sp. A623]